MGRLLLAFVLLPLLGLTEALAHGGSYSPPGPPPPPHQPTGERGQRTPETGGGLPPAWTPPRPGRGSGESTGIPAAFHWSRWWFLNREALLDLAQLRRERVAGMVSGSMSAENREAERRARAIHRIENLALLRHAARDENADLSSAAIIGLGRARDEKAVPVLLELAVKADADPTVRESAALALGMIGFRSELVRETLIEALEDTTRSQRERSFAALGLGILRDRSTLLTLRDRARAKNEDVEVAATCLLALGLSEEEFMGTTLCLSLRSESEHPRRRAHAAAGLGKLGPEGGTPILVKALDAPDADVRRQAALSLGALAKAHDQAARSALGATLATDADSLVRSFAAIALGEIGAPADLAALKKAYRTGDAIVAPHAALAMALMGRANPGEDGLQPRESIRTFLRLQLHEHRDPDLLGALSVAVAIAGDSASAPVLLEHLRSQDRTILRGHAAVALSILGTRTALPALRKALETSRDPILLGELAYALGLFADRKATDLLLAKIRTGSTNLVRGAAAAALGRIDTSVGQFALRKLLSDRDEPAIVRAFAVVGLGFRVQERSGWILSTFGAHLDHAMVRGAVAEVLDFF